VAGNICQAQRRPTFLRGLQEVVKLTKAQMADERYRQFTLIIPARRFT